MPTSSYPSFPTAHAHFSQARFAAHEKAGGKTGAKSSSGEATAAESTSSDAQKVKKPKTKKTKGSGFLTTLKDGSVNIGKRLLNGGKDVLGMFKNWKHLARNTFIYTTALTLINAVWSGPLVIGMIPLFLGISVAFDAITAFTYGITRPLEDDKAGAQSSGSVFTQNA